MGSPGRVCKQNPPSCWKGESEGGGSAAGLPSDQHHCVYAPVFISSVWSAVLCVLGLVNVPIQPASPALTVKQTMGDGWALYISSLSEPLTAPPQNRSHTGTCMHSCTHAHSHTHIHIHYLSCTHIFMHPLLNTLTRTSTLQEELRYLSHCPSWQLLLVKSQKLRHGAHPFCCRSSFSMPLMTLLCFFRNMLGSLCASLTGPLAARVPQDTPALIITIGQLPAIQELDSSLPLLLWPSCMGHREPRPLSKNWEIYMAGSSRQLGCLLSLPDWLHLPSSSQNACNFWLTGFSLVGKQLSSWGAFLTEKSNWLINK